MIQPTQTPHRLRRHILFASLATAALIAATAAAAEPPSAIKIPAGSLESALLALSAQTHQQVMYPHELVAGRTAPALTGTYTVEQAIRLLAPADISITRAGPAVLVLRKADLSSNTASRPEVATGRPFTGDASSAPPESDPPAPVPKTPSPGPLNTVSEVEVTGTHIRGAAVGASPVLALSHADVERSGFNTVVEALEALPQNFTGAGTERTVALGTEAASGNSFYSNGVNLRGLGPNSTLVMINGRRMAGSGLLGDFADISTLPSAAVERVEVLLDGASALYGSDAVGGVVNVIMRQRFDGAETRVDVGGATEGGAGETQVSQTFGKTWSSGSVMLAYEHSQRDDLMAAQRSFTATADLRSLGGRDHRTLFSHPGNILLTDPLTGATTSTFAIPSGQSGVGLLPGQLIAGTANLAEPHEGADILPRQVRDSVYASLNQSFGDHLDLSGDLRFGRRAFDVALAPLTSTLNVTKANPFFVSPTGATSEQIDYSFADDLPNPKLRGVVESLGATLGAQYRLPGDWRVSGYGEFAQERSTTATTGTVNSTALTEALGGTDRPQTSFSAARDGFFNPFGAGSVNNPTVLAFIGSGFTRALTVDQVTSADLKADGPLFNLPAGPLLAAVGVDFRRESYKRTGSSFTSGFAPTASQSTEGARTVGAAYAELRAPILAAQSDGGGIGALDLSLAGRFERYSDFGSTTNPKVGLVWTPNADLRVRGSYGTSFRAPALPELNQPAFFSPSILPLGSAQVLSLLLSGGNPNLRPETASSWTAGLDYTPAQVPGLRISLGWFRIHFENRIDQPVRQNILTALSDPTVASFVSLISPGSNAADLTRISALLASPALNTAFGVFPPTAYGAIVDERYVNTGSLEVSGFDLQAAYGFDVHATHVGLNFNGSYTYQYDQALTPTGPVVSRLNVANFPLRFRGRAAAEASRGPFSAQLALNYSDAYHDALGVPIGQQLTADLQLRTKAPETSVFAGLSVALNVRNLFDTHPPFYDAGVGVAYDPANADPIGRFIGLQLTKAW